MWTWLKRLLAAVQQQMGSWEYWLEKTRLTYSAQKTISRFAVNKNDSIKVAQRCQNFLRNLLKLICSVRFRLTGWQVWPVTKIWRCLRTKQERTFNPKIDCPSLKTKVVFWAESILDILHSKTVLKEMQMTKARFNRLFYQAEESLRSTMITNF